MIYQKQLSSALVVLALLCAPTASFANPSTTPLRGCLGRAGAEHPLLVEIKAAIEPTISLLEQKEAKELLTESELRLIELNAAKIKVLFKLALEQDLVLSLSDSIRLIKSLDVLIEALRSRELEQAEELGALYEDQGQEEPTFLARLKRSRGVKIVGGIAITGVLLFMAYIALGNKNTDPDKSKLSPDQKFLKTRVGQWLLSTNLVTRFSTTSLGKKIIGARYGLTPEKAELMAIDTEIMLEALKPLGNGNGSTQAPNKQRTEVDLKELGNQVKDGAENVGKKVKEGMSRLDENTRETREELGRKLRGATTAVGKWLTNLGKNRQEQGATPSALSPDSAVGKGSIVESESNTAIEQPSDES